jgi:hypothetical protein
MEGCSTMSIEKNKHKIGYGSWWCNQSKKDYPQAMDVNDFLRIIYLKCKERVRELNLQHGDVVRITYIGGSNPRRYKGTINKRVYNDSVIHLTQNKREVKFDITLIDEIEIIARSSKVKSLLDYKREKEQSNSRSYLH